MQSRAGACWSVQTRSRSASLFPFWTIETRFDCSHRTNRITHTRFEHPGVTKCEWIPFSHHQLYTTFQFFLVVETISYPLLLLFYNFFGLSSSLDDVLWVTIWNKSIFSNVPWRVVSLVWPGGYHSIWPGSHASSSFACRLLGKTTAMRECRCFLCDWPRLFNCNELDLNCRDLDARAAM